MLPLPRARPDLRDASIAVLVPEGDTIVRKGDPVSVVRAWAQGLGFEGLSYFAPARDASGGTMTLWSTWKKKSWGNGRSTSCLTNRS